MCGQNWLCKRSRNNINKEASPFVLTFVEVRRFILLRSHLKRDKVVKTMRNLSTIVDS